MKKVLLSFTLITMLSGAVVITSCNNGDKTTTSSEEHKDMYECPMKCEGKTFSESGKCPVCNMELVIAEHKNDGHAH